MNKQEILIDENLNEVTFRVKRVKPKEFENQLELLEATGIIDSIEGYTEDKAEHDLTLEMVYKEACRYINVSPDKVKTKSRKRELVKARRYFSLTTRDIFGQKYTLSAIGELIGGKNHATILHYYKDFDEKQDIDRRLNLKTSLEDKEAIKAIKTNLNGHLKKHYQTEGDNTNGK